MTKESWILQEEDTAEEEAGKKWTWSKECSSQKLGDIFARRVHLGVQKFGIPGSLLAQ